MGVRFLPDTVYRSTCDIAPWQVATVTPICSVSCKVFTHFKFCYNKCLLCRSCWFYNDKLAKQTFFKF